MWSRLRPSSVHAARHARRIFDTPEFYRRVFGELKSGEFLEWYHIDYIALEPLLKPFLERKRRILDVGCGTSRLPQQLAQQGYGRLIVACDACKEAVLQQTLPPRGPGKRLLFRVADVKRRVTKSY